MKRRLIREDLLWRRILTYFLNQIVMQQWEGELLTDKWRETERPLGG